jgi:hypothetical protein
VSVTECSSGNVLLGDLIHGHVPLFYTARAVFWLPDAAWPGTNQQEGGSRTGVINDGISNLHKQESQLPVMDVQRKVSL